MMYFHIFTKNCSFQQIKCAISSLLEQFCYFHCEKWLCSFLKQTLKNNIDLTQLNVHIYQMENPNDLRTHSASPFCNISINKNGRRT